MTYTLPLRGKTVNTGMPKNVSVEYLPSRTCRRIADRLSSVEADRSAVDVGTVITYYNRAMKKLDSLPGYTMIDCGGEVFLAKKRGSEMDINWMHGSANDLFTKTQVWKYRRPIDLGCFIGSIAAQGLILNGASFSCIEYDYEQALVSEISKRKLAQVDPLFSGMNVLWGDYNKLDFSAFDYFFFNGHTPIVDVMQRFAAQAKPTSLFVAVEYDWLGEFEDESVLDVSDQYDAGARVFVHV
ncbi:hypothetical protein ACFLZ2_04650 [Candidatus Margulisiibacteriota bacterium]